MHYFPFLSRIAVVCQGIIIKHIWNVFMNTPECIHEGVPYKHLSKEHDKMLSFIFCQSTHACLSVNSQLFVNVSELTSK